MAIPDKPWQDSIRTNVIEDNGARKFTTGITTSNNKLGNVYIAYQFWRVRSVVSTSLNREY